MGHRKTLNGLPNSLVEKYLSKLTYYDQGYMACWIWKRASELGITALEIDIINELTIPSEMKSKPITFYLSELKETIFKTLTSNDFEINFISKAIFKTEIYNQDLTLNQISFQAILEDVDGRIYVGMVYMEMVQPISELLFEKIIKNLV